MSGKGLTVNSSKPIKKSAYDELEEKGIAQG